MKRKGKCPSCGREAVLGEGGAVTPITPGDFARLIFCDVVCADSFLKLRSETRQMVGGKGGRS